MCRVPLMVFLSFIVLHSVSAGGAYCAKTARARAAALGLAYPGVNGAPDLFGPAGDLERAEPERYMASYRQPGGSPFDYTVHKQAQPRRSDRLPLSHATYKPGHSRLFTSDQMLSFPRGYSVNNRKSSFEEVKHIALPTPVEAFGQSDLVSRYPEGHTKPLSFVYNEHNLVVDESAPNRRGMSLTGLPQPQSKGHGADQRGRGRDVAVLGSSRINNRGRARPMTRQGPASGSWERIRLPGHLAQHLGRNPNVKHFVYGSPVVRYLMKPNHVQLG
ncbi:uncharacterized protein LOC114448939 [Parambassis ranga]|uniref:Uncharacterized protein LOC114448939 n=1 Tax=Parambassis ranga TaxID=210632 RepID=A0A6P7K2P9_9TELE|nr:uncharacterized protein LOC114448939 [Parambassis ranga]